MTARSSLRAFALGAAAACAAIAVTAKADVTKDQCIDANAKAQSLRREGRFAEARQRLAFCVDSRCPRIVTSDCAARLEEVERAQPTIVVDAKDPRGVDVSAAAVNVDGHVVSEQLDGTALAVDPGVHTVTLEVAGAPAATRTFVAKEGEKGRRISLVVGDSAAGRALPSPAAAPSSPAVPVPSAPPASAGTHEQNGGAQRTLGFVVGGVGLAGLAAGSVLGILAVSAKNDYEGHCGSNIGAAPNVCTTQGVDGHADASSKAGLSTAFFIGGGVAMAGGVLLLATAPRGGVSVDVGLRLGGLLVRGAF